MNGWSMTISFTKRDGNKAKNPFGNFYATEEAKAAKSGILVNVFKKENAAATDPRDLVVYVRKAGEKDKAVNVGALTPVPQTEANKEKIAAGKSPYAKGTLDLTQVGGPNVGPIVAWYKTGTKGAFLSVSPDKPRTTEAAAPAPAAAAPVPVAETEDIPF